MQYVHVKNLEKYHPSYKDRNLIWCKAYFTMVNAEPEFEMLEEIDKWRFIAFIMLEIQSKKPIPLDEKYLTRKGFDLKKRPISRTLQVLHNFADVITINDEKIEVTDNANVTQLSNERYESVTQRREEKRREEKINVTKLTEEEYLTKIKDFFKTLDLTTFREKYGSVDLNHEVEKAKMWLVENCEPKKRKNKFNLFLINWLDRAKNGFPIPQRT